MLMMCYALDSALPRMSLHGIYCWIFNAVFVTEPSSTYLLALTAGDIA